MTKTAQLIALTTLLTFPRVTLSQASPVDSLRWLTGCWKVTRNTLTIEEHWMAPAGGVMLGMSRTVRGGAVREHEFIRLYSAGDTLVYAAMPSGQKLTEFRGRPLSASEVMFENPAHDFPQRIRYQLSGDTLTATIEGDRAGRRAPVAFVYQRAACSDARP